jgi:MFS family permease
MPNNVSTPTRHVTLLLCMVLHAFTHAYGSMLVPLYLLMVSDLHLSGSGQASLLVAIYILVYALFSFVAGMLTDRFDRKWLLGVGLIVNAVAMILIGVTRRYELLIAWAVLAGLSGTLFHPAAGALVPAHYPKNPGMAVGLLGIGSGIGFFVGPRYSGWRAQSAQWQWGQVAQWQKPCVELGLVGLIVGVLFLLIAREADRHVADRGKPMGAVMSRRIVLIALALGCRDFAGIGGLSLASLYLQRALHYDAKHTGAVLGTMMLLSVLVNPLLVYLTPGLRRLPSLAISLLMTAALAAIVPCFGPAWVMAALCAFQTCQLGSYAISDAAILERVPSALRGRVYGLFLLIAGTIGSSGPWLMGWSTDALGTKATNPNAYFPLFGTLAALTTLATLATPVIARLGPATNPTNPLEEIVPPSAELIG